MKLLYRPNVIATRRCVKHRHSINLKRGLFAKMTLAIVQSDLNNDNDDDEDDNDNNDADDNYYER